MYLYDKLPDFAYYSMKTLQNQEACPTNTIYQAGEQIFVAENPGR